MPGKEALVEVETNGVVPEPVTKEIPKCESASVEVKGKKDEDPETLKPAETGQVADSAESKPQDTEITSSEQKPEKQVTPSDKKDKVEPSADSVNGSDAKPEEKTVVSAAEGGAAANGKTQPDESPAKSKVEGSEVEKSSEDTTKAVSEVDAKNLVEAKPSDSTIDSNTSEVPVAEAMEEDETKTSEAAAKSLPSDSDKIVVENDSKPKASPDVTGSDEAKNPQDGTVESSTEKSSGNTSSSETKTDEKTSGKPSSETNADEKPTSETNADEKPGSSSTAVEPDLETQVAELKKKGVALYVGRDYCAAADTFGKILEMAAPLYGEMSEKLAETYYMYGTSMFEYGKDQNDVLGEKVKEKDEKDEDDEEVGEDEQMEVDNDAEPAAEDSAEKQPSAADGSGDTKDHEDDEKEPADETITGEDKEDDEDDAFRVAWEMLELAKATFQKADNKKRLADTLMKLGDVGIETGDANAIAEMVEGLKVRKEVYPANHRIIPETHFKIGVAFAYFEKYDEAIQQFTDAKDCLEKRIEELSKSETKEDKDEVEEMKSILPEIQEKIQDTKESKLDKEKIKGTMGESSKEAAAAPFPASSEDKPVSNISHLVKRKRKVDEILPERAAKQSRQEGDADVASTTTTEEPEVNKKKVEETAKSADCMETSEPKQTEEKKVVESKEGTQSEEMKPSDQSKPEEKPEMKSEEKSETKSEEKPETKSEEKPEVKSEEKTETKSDEKAGDTAEGVKDIPQSEAKKPEEATDKAAEPSKPEEVKPAKVEAKSDEPEKMEE